MALIHLSAPDVGALETDAVARAMAGGWISTTGPDLSAFEDEAARLTGVRHAVAVNSGTSALHLALLAVGVGPGDVVPTSSMTFAATANAIRYTGATPYFVDSDPATGNIDVELLATVLERLTRDGHHIGAVMPVDLLGLPVDHHAIEALCRSFDVPLVPDAAESFGSTIDGRHTGSFGAAAGVSFNGNKIMTTSGGGMVLTDDGDIATRVRHLASQAREPVAHYEHHEIGYNYRLSNVLAALGRAQLTRLDDMIARRRAWRAGYRDLVRDFEGVRVLGDPAADGDNCWLTAIIIDPESAGRSAQELGRVLAGAGIETRALWKPMHRQVAHRAAPAAVTGVADRLFARGLVLPSGSSMSDQTFDRICAEIGRAL